MVELAGVELPAAGGGVFAGGTPVVLSPAPAGTPGSVSPSPLPLGSVVPVVFGSVSPSWALTIPMHRTRANKVGRKTFILAENQGSLVGGVMGGEGGRGV